MAGAEGRGRPVADVVFRSDMTVELIKHAACDADVIWAARVSTKGEQSPGPGRMLVQTGKPGAYEFTAGTPEQHALVSETARESYRQAYAAYLTMLNAGVAREVARTVLPSACIPRCTPPAMRAP